MTMLIADTERKLQESRQTVVKERTKKGLNNSCKKTKWLPTRGILQGANYRPNITNVSKYKDKLKSKGNFYITVLFPVMKNKFIRLFPTSFPPPWRCISGIVQQSFSIAHKPSALLACLGTQRAQSLRYPKWSITDTHDCSHFRRSHTILWVCSFVRDVDRRQDRPLFILYLKRSNHSYVFHWYMVRV